MRKLVYCFLLIPAFLTASKGNLPIELLALQADIIVVGEITNVKNDSYDFKVLDHIKGSNDSILAVEQFKEWICDIRYEKVKKGQRLFLFLKRTGGKLEIINGSTGEIPIQKGKVKLNAEEYKHISGEFHPYELKYEEFRLGINGLLRCYAMLSSCNLCVPEVLNQLCNESEVKTFASTSMFAEWLFVKIKGRYKIISKTN